ncbi:MAG TPA: SurA N-terminal domain-containing protein, partial [Pyrinomonadaceae bacterium]|nr:SurA N-terminal domain-containing protein [Pyrinomonadaceae bacterium]
MHRAAKPFATLFAVAALAVTLAACNSGKNETNSKDIAATVNGKSITLKDVDQRVNQRANGQMAQMSPLQLAASRLQELESLIQQEVLFQRAEKEKLAPSEDDVTREINTRKQAGNLTEEEYQRQLRESGQTEQTLRESIRKEVAVQRLQEKVIANISISDREVEDAYNKNRQLFVNRRGVALAAIMADGRESGGEDDAKNPTEAKLKIDDIYQQLSGGSADFATIARQRSEDASAQVGGDIGVFDENQLKQLGFPEEEITRLFGETKIGGITKPVQFGDGRWAIFKLTARQLENQNQTLDEARPQIKEALLGQRRQLLTLA